MICSIYNLGHNISEFTVFQCRSYLPKVQRNLKFLENLQKTFLYKSSYKLPNDLRLKISGNYNMLGKSKNWVETEFSLYFTLRKFFFSLFAPTVETQVKADINIICFFPFSLAFSRFVRYFFQELSVETRFCSLLVPVLLKPNILIFRI